MRTAGIREARHAFTSLIEEVGKGREVLITDRGRAVARLVPVRPRQPFPDLTSVRALTRGRNLAATQAVLDDRDDRV
jgi:prevent-host-death family protein